MISRPNVLFLSLSLHEEEAEEDGGVGQEEGHDVQQAEPGEDVGAEALREGGREGGREGERGRERIL